MPFSQVFFDTLTKSGYIDLVVGISFWKILSEVYKLMIKDYVIEYLEETFNFLNYFADNIDIFKLKDKNICHF